MIRPRRRSTRSGISINHGILDMEPPDHTRVRRLVSKAFTPRMVESMRAPVQELTDELVDAVAGGARSTCSRRSPSRCRWR